MGSFEHFRCYVGNRYIIESRQFFAYLNCVVNVLPVGWSPLVAVLSVLSEILLSKCYLSARIIVFTLCSGRLYSYISCFSAAIYEPELRVKDLHLTVCRNITTTMLREITVFSGAIQNQECVSQFFCTY